MSNALQRNRAKGILSRHIIVHLRTSRLNLRVPEFERHIYGPSVAGKNVWFIPQVHMYFPSGRNV